MQDVERQEMKKLFVVAGVVGGFLAFLAFSTSATSSAAPVDAPAACVVANVPASLHLQLGYAPNGPEDCQQV
jgi:hypothetical protein